jgi:hypothetical protein
MEYWSDGGEKEGHWKNGRMAKKEHDLQGV